MSIKTDSFRFSRNKRSKFSITFNDFSETTKALESILRNTRRKATPKIFTCEDIETYLGCKITKLTPDSESARKNREKYLLNQFDENVWNRSYKVELIFSEPNSSDYFMVELARDVGEPEKLSFYGQGLNLKTHQCIVSRFKKKSLLWAIGDGYPKHEVINFRSKGRLKIRAPLF